MKSREIVVKHLKETKRLAKAYGDPQRFPRQFPKSAQHLIDLFISKTASYSQMGDNEISIGMLADEIDRFIREDIGNTKLIEFGLEHVLKLIKKQLNAGLLEIARTMPQKMPQDLLATTLEKESVAQEKARAHREKIKAKLHELPVNEKIIAYVLKDVLSLNMKFEPEIISDLKSAMELFAIVGKRIPTDNNQIRTMLTKMMSNFQSIQPTLSNPEIHRILTKFKKDVQVIYLADKYIRKDIADIVQPRFTEQKALTTVTVRRHDTTSTPTSTVKTRTSTPECQKTADNHWLQQQLGMLDSQQEPTMLKEELNKITVFKNSDLTLGEVGKILAQRGFSIQFSRPHSESDTMSSFNSYSSESAPTGYVSFEDEDTLIGDSLPANQKGSWKQGW